MCANIKNVDKKGMKLDVIEKMSVDERVLIERKVTTKKNNLKKNVCSR